MEILSLFKAKIRLNSKKYLLIDKIDHLGLKKEYIKELRVCLKKERKVNKEIEKEIRNLSKIIDLTIVKREFAHLRQSTAKQTDILKRIRLRILKKSNYEKFKDACRREVEQNKLFSTILRERILRLEGAEIPKEEFQEGKLLVKQAQKTYQELVRAVGNVKKVQQKAKELILINRKLKKTKLYEFIKYDVDLVTKKATYALKNPKESRLKFLLAGAYIVSPGTFELTGIYLFFRYIKKYAQSKKFSFKNRKV